MPLALAGLEKFEEKGNSLIVNIENNTTITTMLNGEIYKVNTIEKGMKEILESIEAKELSYERAYEICKNSTIYRTEIRDLKTDGNEYMHVILPVLDDIVQSIKKLISVDGIEIENIYITGMGAVINNIDLYFQESFTDQTCEIVSAYFAKKVNVQINVKEYIEVNSAIALALQGLDKGQRPINFVKQQKSLEIEKDPKKLSIYRFNLGERLDRTERNLIRSAVALAAVIVIYIMFVNAIRTQMVSITAEIEEYIDRTNEEIQIVNDYTRLVKSRTRNYERIIARLQETPESISLEMARRNAIPNLLDNLMTAIPQEIQLVNLSNLSGDRVIIEVKAENYQYLGLLLGRIRDDEVLFNVTSTTGVRDGDYIMITIEGDLFE